MSSHRENCCIYTLWLKSHNSHSRIHEPKVMNLTFFSKNLSAHFIHAGKMPQHSDDNSFANKPNYFIWTRPLGFDVHNIILKETSLIFNLSARCHEASIITLLHRFLGWFKYIIHSFSNYSLLNGVRYRLIREEVVQIYKHFEQTTRIFM